MWINLFLVSEQKNHRLICDSMGNLGGCGNEPLAEIFDQAIYLLVHGLPVLCARI